MKKVLSLIMSAMLFGLFFSQDIQASQMLKEKNQVGINEEKFNDSYFTTDAEDENINIYGTTYNAGIDASELRSGLKTRTQQEIRDRAKELSFSLREPITYTKKPNAAKPYSPGAVSGSCLEGGLNAVNLMRYIAGLPDDVEFDSAYCDYAQHASVLLAANSELTHFPNQPSDMSDEFYQSGQKGASSSNLANGYSNFADSIVNGYMSDSDSGNIDRVGHRRWILNPPLKKIGLGHAGNYSALYVFDWSRTESFDYTSVKWPAEQMPIEYFGNYSAWSVNLSNQYSDPDISEVTVTMERVSDGQKWIFDKNNSSSEIKYFNINNDGYGMGKCIIFRPDACYYKNGDQFNVCITGLKDLTGNPTQLEYTVNFFCLNEVTNVKLNRKSISLTKGKTYYLDAAITPQDATISNLQWTSSNPKVAAVDEYGVVTAKGIGTATITATADGGISVKGSCKITVGYGITYQLNGGKNHKSNPYVYTKNQTVTLKSPTRKGYSFKGWYTDRNYKNKITEILSGSKKSYTLYARWERN